MPYTIPAPNKVSGQTGFIADIDNAYAALAAVAGTNVLDSQWSGGADPTGVLDSTAAFQAAVNGAGAGVTFVPPGTYKLATSALNPSTVSGGALVGVGSASRLLWDGGAVPTLLKMADTTQRIFHIRDMRITNTNASPVGTAIDASYFVYSEWERLLIDGSTAAGPNQGIICNASGSFYNWVKNCRVNVDGANAIGVRFDGGSNNNHVLGGRVFISATDSSQIGYVINAKSCSLYSPNCQNGAGVGIDVQATGHACTIYDAYLEANATANLRLASGVLAPTLIGGTVENDLAFSPNIIDNGARIPVFLSLRTSKGGDIYADSRALVAATPEPEDFGYIAWNYDPATAGTGIASTAGTIYLAQVAIRRAVLVSKLSTFLTAGSVTPTANQNFLALVNASGAIQCATAAGAIDTASASSGWLTGSVATPTVVPPGLYWVAMLFNAATPPSFARGTTTPGGANVGLTSSFYRYAVNGTAATALPASFTPGSNTQSGVITMPVAVS